MGNRVSNCSKRGSDMETFGNQNFIIKTGRVYPHLLSGQVEEDHIEEVADLKEEMKESRKNMRGPKL
jgi:hypothetical protein